MAHIICLRTLSPYNMTLKQVGNIYGISVERTRQIEAKGLRLLRNCVARATVAERNENKL